MLEERNPLAYSSDRSETLLGWLVVLEGKCFHLEVRRDERGVLRETEEKNLEDGPCRKSHIQRVSRSEIRTQDLYLKNYVYKQFLKNPEVVFLCRLRTKNSKSSLKYSLGSGVGRGKDGSPVHQWGVVVNPCESLTRFYRAQFQMTPANPGSSRYSLMEHTRAPKAQHRFKSSSYSFVRTLLLPYKIFLLNQ